MTVSQWRRFLIEQLSIKQVNECLSRRTSGTRAAYKSKVKIIKENTVLIDCVRGEVEEEKEANSHTKRQSTSNTHTEK